MYLVYEMENLRKCEKILIYTLTKGVLKMYGSKTKRIEPGGVTFVASLAQSIFKIAY